jgi:hypothetical protein
MRIRRISGAVPPRPVRPVELHGPEDMIPAPPPPPPPEPPPPDRADWGAHAERRRVEDDMQETARQAELQPSGIKDPLHQVLSAARKAGLKPTEITRLRSQLTALPEEQLTDEIDFLRSAILRSGQPHAALRLYMAHNALASAHPDRLTPSLMHDLVRCQLRPPGAKTRHEDLLKGSESGDAASALAGMTSQDYSIALAMLREAGPDQESRTHARIFREIARRKDSLVNPAIQDQFRNMVGLPSYFLSEVQAILHEMHSRTGELQPHNMASAAGEIRPDEYLKDGFLTADHRLHASIYGYCSLAMAHRCRLEGMDPGCVRDLVDILSRIGEEIFDLAGYDPDLLLEESIRAEFLALAELEDVKASPALRELMSASELWLVRFCDLAALAVHLERILSHLSLDTK